MSSSLTTCQSAEKRVWYLLLRFAAPLPDPSITERNHFAKVEKACKTLGIAIRPLNTYYRSPGTGPTRYLFRFPHYKRNDAAAQRFGESFLFSIGSICGPLVNQDFDEVILRVPDLLVRDKKELQTSKLIELEESRPYHERTILRPSYLIYLIISSVCTTTVQEFESAWEITPLAYRDETIFNALRFLKTSQDHFFVYPGQLEEAFNSPDLLPRSATHQTNFEHALQDAFKAIEAIIGDPPRSDHKLFFRLINLTQQNYYLRY